jgi:DNA-binding HxlR family transcriptional regulator
MASRRSYGDRCGVARALDTIGERWALLVVRDLLLGPKRFSDLQAGLPRLSPDVLTQRLRELVEAGVIHRRKLPKPAGSWVYELTDWGRELEPIVTSLGLWGSRARVPTGQSRIGVDSVILGMRTTFSSERAEGLSATYALRVGGEPFQLTISDRSLDVRREETDEADAAIDTDPSTLETLLWGGGSLQEALRGSELTIDGKRALIERFLQLFPAPQAA